MSKYTWNDMELCKKCHFKDDNDPDICHATGEPIEKPGSFGLYSDCVRGIRETKWQRMSEEERAKYISQ